jgi:hypothetical protein
MDIPAQSDNKEKTIKNPWLRPAPDYYYPVEEIEPVSAQDRLEELKGFDKRKITEIIAWPGTQRTVKLAAERRLKKLLRRHL